MAVGHVAVGERLYVFSSNGGNQTTQGCVIDAHGEQRLFNNTFPVQRGVTVRFYVPQGSPQKYHNGQMRFNDAADNFHYTDALETISRGLGVEHEHYSTDDDCPDYNLTKIQKSSSRFTNWMDNRNDMSYRDVERLIEYYNAMDIVTLRSRSMKTSITLERAIDALLSAGYGYAEIHCSFCRNPQTLITSKKSAQVRRIS